MDASARERADERLEKALEGSPLADPRPHYREWIRTLKERDPAAFDRAIAYYEDTLIDRIVRGGDDPIESWLDYGRYLAELSGAGRLVAIDANGRAGAMEADVTSVMVLHLPGDESERPMVLAFPAQPSAAQQATYRLLVEGRQQL